MKIRRFLCNGILTLLALIMIGVDSRALPGLHAGYRPSATLLAVSTIPETPEAQAIKAALQQAKDAIATALQTGDLTALDTSLVDHPDYLKALPPQEVEELRTFISRILGPSTAKEFGYLTAMKNKITYRLQGEAFVQAEIDKARAANRAFTAADLQELMRQHPDKRIVMPRAEREFVTPQPEQRLYKSIKIEGDKAWVIYEDVKDRTALFVRIDGKWYVAGIF